ncbi:hypothetical protein N657DRAFT_650651 [Parathielavia appendiculata]|uniref:Orc1-like AAA ATPase domain-containing protein n=1 Tax=Parathielavia appendiculata TaxID=2587402 RepID=A0AAN6TRI6_9PEZI|nr:hypothetical protein N657DRAFT_650651 [Parathielavia appendiculata]
MSSRSSRWSRLLHRPRSRVSSTPRPSPQSSASLETSAPQASTANAVPAAVSEPCPQGLGIVAEGINPTVDIIAVHGLNGHREKTWTASNGVHWLRDLLPHDIPHARIFCWGYDANTHASSRVSCQYLYDHARTLISDLCRKRKLSDSMERPIIFVAHSLGGIVVKSALIHSDAARRGALEEHRSIKVSTYGVVFMGTPHQGGNGVQLGRLLVNVASLFVAADDRILRHLERDSEWLQQQLGQYGPISGDFVTKFASEEYETPMAFGHSIMVVPRASAVVPGQADAESIVIHADHTNMVRYTSRGDSGYNIISEYLQIMASAASEEVRRRWEAERRADEAHLGHPSAAFGMHFSLPEINEVHHFVAREEELAGIHRVLGEGSGRRIVVVHGLGGMGKTQLAAAYAKRHREDYSAVFWLNARDETSLRQGFARVADRVFREHPSVVYVRNAAESRDLNEAVQAVKRWLDNNKNDRWLVIYDNYDNPRLGGGGDSGPNEGRGGGLEGDRDANIAEGYDIRPFLPDAHHGAIVITTRSSRVTVGHRIPLRKLKDLEDSLEILAYTSNRHDLRKDAAAVQLARKLDGLPLALSTAGAYLDNVATSFAEYLEMYRKSWLRLQKTTPGLLSYEDRALYSTWDISYAQVEQQNMTSARLLQLWAYFGNEDLWFELLLGGRSSSPQWFRELTGDMLGFTDAVRVLCDYGLVEADTSLKERGTESRGYGMHGCVHSWTIHVLNEVRNIEMAQLAMRCVGLHVPTNMERDYWVVQRRLMQHADRCLEMVVMDRVSILEGDEWVLHNLGDFYTSQGRLSDAQAMYERALQSKEKALGPEHTSTHSTVNNLGLLYKAQGRLSDAEAMYERALRGSEKVLRPEHTSTLITVNNLGDLYADQGRFSDAEAMYERALRGKEKALGPEHTSTLATVNNLGNLYANQGRLSDAEVLYKRALQGYKKALGPEHTSTLDTVNNLGLLYADQGRLSDAEAMYERALQGREKALGTEHTSTLDTVNNLGLLYADQGRLSDAEAMYERALRGREKALGPEHTSTLDTVNNLGLLYADQGRLSDAEAMYERALRGREKALGSEHTLTLSTVNNLGRLYAYQGRLSDAEVMYKRALRGYEKVLGPEQVNLYIPALNTILNLAIIYSRLHNISESRVLYLRCQGGIKAVFGVQHDWYQEVTRRLASLNLDQY